MIKIDFTTKQNIPKYVKDEYGRRCLYDQNGQRHRYNDLPAVISKYGRKYWYKHGVLHRQGGKPAIIKHNDKKEYWVNGKRIK